MLVSAVRGYSSQIFTCDHDDSNYTAGNVKAMLSSPCVVFIACFEPQTGAITDVMYAKPKRFEAKAVTDTGSHCLRLVSHG